MQLRNSHNIMESENNHPRLSKLLASEHNRSWQFKDVGIRSVGKPEIEPVKDDTYLEMFDSYEDAEIEAVINTVLGVSADRPNGYTEDDVPRMIEQQYTIGDLLCVAFLPFNNQGDERGAKLADNFEDWMANGTLIRRLIVDPKDHLSRGFGQHYGYFFDYLPDCLKKDISEGGCTFKLDYPFALGDPRNGAWFHERYVKALANLRALLLGRDLH